MELTLDLQSPTRVQVLCEQHFSHTFDLQSLTMANEAAREGLLDHPEVYGKKLYAALLPPDTLARQALLKRPERVLLVPLQEALDAVPWEYTYGPWGNGDAHETFLVLCCPVVRGLPPDQRRELSVASTGLHVIAVPASPLSRTTVPLPIERDWTLLREVIEDVSRVVTLERCRPPTLKRLRELVANESGKVVHFIGHGGQRLDGAILCFEQENADLHVVTAQELLKRLQRSAFLVTLSACVSASSGPTALNNVAASLVGQGVPYALGMRLSIYDVDARAFFRVFYSELARGSSVEQALFQARLALAEDSPRRWVIGVPVLYTSLVGSIPEFVCPVGEPVLLEHEPSLNVDVLPPTDGPFRGRLEELVELGTALTNPRPPSLITIHGSGGQGKTALAREAATRFAWAWPGGIWALSLETLPTRDALVLELASLLGVETQGLTEARQIERRVQDRLRRKRTLLILDNLETAVEVLEQDAEARSLMAWLKQLRAIEGVTLLVTSRELLGWSEEKLLDLPGLTPEDGATLFLQCAGQRSHAADRASVHELSQRLDGHPLSLRLLGHVFGAGVQSIAALLTTLEQELLQAHDKYLGPEHRHYKLYACLDMSVRVLSSELRETLYGLGIFHAPFLAETAVIVLDPEHVETEQEPSRVRQALPQLWRRGLLNTQTFGVRDGEVQLFVLLPTTRLYLAQGKEQPRKHEEVLRRFGQALLQLIRRLYVGIDRSAALVVIAQQGMVDLDRGWRSLTGEEAGAYLLRWGWILYRLGRTSQGLERLEQALELVEEKRTDLMLQVLNNMALVYQTIGQPQRALDLYTQALPIRQEVGDRSGEGATLNNMAAVYQAIGQPQRALDLYAQALPIRQEVGDRAGEGTTLNNMASVYRAIGQPQRALDLYTQALPIRQEVGDRSGEGTTLNNMAGVYQAIGQPQRALDLYTQALPITQEVGDRSGEATTLNNMASVYHAIGQPQRALDLYAQALPILTEVGDRSGEARALNNMAGVYQTIGQPQRALDLYTQALPIRQEVGDRSGQASTLNGMGYLYRDMQRYADALEAFDASLLLEEETSHLPGLIAGLIARAELLHRYMGRSADALQSLEQAQTLFRSSGLSHDAAGQTLDVVERLLEEVRQGPPRTDEQVISPEIVQAIRDFLNTPDWQTAQHIVEAQQTLLFQQIVDEIFEQNIRQAQQTQKTQWAEQLTMHRDILRACQREGIEATFAPLIAASDEPENETE